MPKGPVIMRCYADAGIITGTSPVGCWLRSWDLDARGGRGTTDWTDDPAKAHVFPTAIHAMLTWRTRSTALPTRPDGQPNRPLTAYTVTFDPAPSAGAP